MSVKGRVIFSTSVDDDQLKAKIGQILYNNYITERLREEVLQRVAHRNSLALRMSLGRDPTGDEVFLDILVNRVRPEVEELKRSIGSAEGRSGGDFKKYTCVILSSDSVQSNDNLSIASNFEYLMSQSLNWWARYSGSRDTLNVDKWKIENAVTVDSKSAYLSLEIPIENISVPDSRRYDTSELGKNVNLDTLPPVTVRTRDKNRFELIQGYHILQAYINAGRREIPVLVKNVTDEEADRLFDQSRRAWENLPIRSR